MRPRLLLVDDHRILREGLAAMLNLGWGYNICGEAENGREAIQKANELQPDVVILDLRMPVMGGTEAAPQIRRVSPRTKIVFLSMHDSRTAVELARLAGADACVSKRCRSEELHQAIVRVLRSPSVRAEHTSNANKLGLLDPT
jgi:DNA-binding NarL/FixJ family response regulator